MSLPSYAMRQASFPALYERWLVTPLFRPWAEIALDALELGTGDRVLDIACGTGIAARVARERLGTGGSVVGVDLSRDMLDVARGLAPGIDWREGNAQALPLGDGERFDVVICQQGLQFFPDKAAAAAEMRRATAPGGRLAVSVWRSDAEIPFFRELRRVGERHLGAIADQRYAFGEAAPLAALLGDAGFSEVRVRTVTRTIRFKDGAPFARLNAMALVGMSNAGKAMGEDDRKQAVDTIIADSVPVLERYADGAGVAFELGTNLATARG